ncbi:FitA-like ribbon-helix-helix domain-containing protein [Roseomonas sp. AR75]|uniref:FitA-like ribbon-helix-helix domain-containing protein n=1 Tax=Roseomonas sp. AR75 TaxID=2562311 RepID=UPI0010C03489|nr:toxin-antitoxin system [Roseomonas sp. AR75]
MAQLIVRNLDDSIRDRLRRRAERKGRSMEEEVREILRAAAAEDVESQAGLGTRIAAHFAGIGLTEEEARGIEELRGAPARPASFE